MNNMFTTCLDKVCLPLFFWFLFFFSNKRTVYVIYDIMSIKQKHQNSHVYLEIHWEIFYCRNALLIIFYKSALQLLIKLTC